MQLSGVWVSSEYRVSGYVGDIHLTLNNSYLYQLDCINNLNKTRIYHHLNVHVRSTPLPHVYIHGQLHRSVTDSVNHIQLPLMALTWVTKILINVFRQSRCQTRVKVFVIFYNGDDRNDRNDKNDKESEKSYVRAIARGLWISCHSCHLCHWGIGE